MRSILRPVFSASSRHRCSSFSNALSSTASFFNGCGDEMMRVTLYEAAQSMLRSKKWSWLKTWAMQIARRRG
jgi:transposase